MESMSTPLLEVVDEGRDSSQSWTKRVKELICGGKYEEEELNDVEPARFFDLFRFTSRRERILLLIGCLCAALEGALQPFLNFTTGRLATLYVSTKEPIGNTEFLNTLLSYASILVGIGAFVFIFATAERFLLAWVSEQTVKRVRQEFLKSVLKQDTIFLDGISAGTMSSQMNDNIDRIRDGIGSKIGLFIRSIATLSFGLVGCFLIDWRITLIMFSLCPIAVVNLIILTKLTARPTKQSMKTIEEANGLAEECITNVKTVAACNGQKTMIEKFSELLQISIRHTSRIGFLNGFSEGFYVFCIYVFQCVGLWYGIVGYHGGWVANAGDIFAVTNSLMYAAAILADFTPHLTSIMKARLSATLIYTTIDRESSIPLDDHSGSDPSEGNCSISLENVHFAYASRPAKVLQGLSWSVKEGETVALVGKSGCGKSTSIGLITRLFECTEGTVRIGSHPIQMYNLRKLRQLIGLVSQDPVVFNCSIRENIQMGRNVSNEQIREAAMIANAHGFIMNTEKGYDTILGPSELTLSGGQKQRIAIARAIVTNPQILLLDEATSALDTHSERIVQAALNKASAGRTTVVVAHRLSTIKNVNRIFVIDEGTVVEEGTYNELVNKDGGIFAELVWIQDHEEIVKPTAKMTRKSRESRDSYHSDEPKFTEKMSVEEEKEDNSSDESSSEEVEMSFPSSQGGLMSILSQDWPKISLQMVTASVMGAEDAFWSFLMYLVFRLLRSDSTTTSYETLLRWTMPCFFGLGLICWFAILAGNYVAGWAGETIMTKIRVKCFKSILHRPMAYFDRKETSSSAVSVALAQQAPMIAAATDFRFTMIYQNVTRCLLLTICCFVYSWPNGIMCVVTGLTYIVMFYILQKRSERANERYDAADTSGEAALEIFTNAKAIQLLTVEKFFTEKFENIQEDCHVPLRRRTIMKGLVYGVSQSFFYITYCLAAAVGGYSVYLGIVSVEQQFASEICVASVAFAIIVLDSFDDIIAAVSASKRLFALISPNEVDLNEGSKPDIHGAIQARGVSFAYPSRPNYPVADDISFHVGEGRSIALVGPSGGGKSTIVNLLERFYEANEGYIALDGHNLPKISLHHLRSNVSLVSQEPVLFRGTIADNIRLGCEAEVTLEQIREACRLANATDFIESFPGAYETQVGEKGRSLSGGQKQRVAIARALIRRPKVVVLDEATSALDSHSQRAVKMALEESAKGRTSVVIAHRLDTVRHCDEICYVERGRIVERGNHAELMKKDGKYAALVREQKLL